MLDNIETYEFVGDDFNSINQDFEFESENIQKSYLSMTFGARTFLHDNIFVKAQYEVGLFDLFKDEQFMQDTTRVFSFDNFRHSVFTATVGYQF